MNRVELINLLISHIDAQDYLEIGVRYGRCLSCIKAPNRTGVDPAPVLHEVEEKYHAGLEGVEMHVCTSDEFFARTSETFDVVFVDGMHLYEFAMRDLLNSLNRLNPGGFVVAHDLCPRNAVVASRKRKSTEWNGDVWKITLDVHMNYPGIGYCVMDTDFGLGVFWKKDDNKRFLPAWREDFVSLPFSAYEKYHHQFQLRVEPEETAVLAALKGVERVLEPVAKAS